MPASSLGAVRRPLFWMGLSFLVVVALGLVLSSWALLGCAAGAVLLFQWLSLGRIRFFVLLVLAALVGWGTLLLHQIAFFTQTTALFLPQKSVMVTMTVEELVQRGAYRRYRGWASVSNGADEMEREITISSYLEAEVFPGEVLHGIAILSAQAPPTRLTDPIRLRMTQILPIDALARPHPVRMQMIQWRALLSARIAALAPGEGGAVLGAMLVGDQTRLSPALRADFRRSGLSHILVVSGMHLVVLCSMLSVLLFPLEARLRALLLLLFCWGFALLTGAGSSVIRAALMMSLTQIGPLLDQQSDALTSLSVAGVLMAIQNPAAILTVSFGLSFGAVAGLALLERPVRRLLCGKSASRLRKRLCSNLAAGISAQAGAAPVVLSTFGLFPLLGIVANLLVIELIGPLMLLGLLALLLSFWATGLSALLFGAAQGLALVLLAVARSFSSLPFSQVGIDARWQVAGLVGLFLLVVCLLAHRPGKGVAALALLGWCAVFLTAALVATVTSRGYASVLIDQDGTTVVVHENRAILLGTPGDTWAADALADAMLRLGVERIDGVVLLEKQVPSPALVRLLNRFEGSRRLAAWNLPATRRFCETTGISLCALPPKVTIFGAADATRTAEGWRISFSNATLLKSEQNCVIIGKYSRALPLGEEILHCRVRLEETNDSAK